MIDGIDLEPDNHDSVEGYTIRELEDALDGESTWDGWKTSIKNTYENDTEEELDDLFTFWRWYY